MNVLPFVRTADDTGEFHWLDNDERKLWWVHASRVFTSKNASRGELLRKGFIHVVEGRDVNTWPVFCDAWLDVVKRVGDLGGGDYFIAALILAKYVAHQHRIPSAQTLSRHLGIPVQAFDRVQYVTWLRGLTQEEGVHG